MDDFRYRDGRLFCEGVPVEAIADQAGTPVYVYSASTLRRHFGAFREAFAPLGARICFSIKSLANIHVLRLLAGEGSDFDVTSGGELERARVAGGELSRVVYAGAGKTDREIRRAIAAGIALFNVESEQEFENLARLAAEAGRTVRAALRVNPDIYDAKTHNRTATGRKSTKFGVDYDRAERFFQAYGRNEHARLDAIHIHIGSPIYSPEPYVLAIRKVLELIERLAEQGFAVRTLDVGGGFAADYEEGTAPTAAQYAAAIVPLLAERGLEIILEPGRQIACNSGILLTRVQYVKQGGDKTFVVADAGMTDLIRPVLYDAKHFIYPAALPDGAQPPPRRIAYAPPGGRKVDVVSGVCETDWLGKDRVLPPLARGDLLAVFSAGAYGFVMSSQYNSRPRAAEVLVEGDRWRIIRRRETEQDLLGPELEV